MTNAIMACSCSCSYGVCTTGLPLGFSGAYQSRRHSVVGFIARFVGVGSIDSHFVKKSDRIQATKRRFCLVVEAKLADAVAPTEAELGDAALESIREEENEIDVAVDEVAAVPACPVPDFSEPLKYVTLMNPLKVLPELQTNVCMQRPMIVYVPGMDCTGQGIRPQLPSLGAAGFDIRCVYIPSSDRSSWPELVNTLIPLLENEAKHSRHITLVGESFGGRLALHLARAAGDIISQLVLVNPATNFPDSNRIASLFCQTGLLGVFPEPLYEFAQDILLPMMVKQNRVSAADNEDLLSPVDFVPPDCAGWRLSMLNDTVGLSDQEIRSIKTPTLILCSAKDRMLSSLDEGVRLQSLLPNAKRVVLPESGHMALLEDSIDLVSIMETNGFSLPDRASVPDVLRRRKEEAVPDHIMDELGRILQPWRLLTSPLVTGAENLPSLACKRPVLFVGNHTVFGVYDSAVLVHELYLRGFRCRSLAHPGHWMSGLGPLFERYGSVKATPFEAYRLLKEGEHVLLFPGGAREVCKRRGEEYKLLWKSTIDFVRMAIRLNAIIVPFAALGGDEAFSVLFDSDEILNSPFGGLVRQVYTSLNLSTENIHPISAFPFTNLPSPIPLPSSIKRIYFHFAEYIDTAEVKINVQNREECRALYLLVKGRVEKSIDQLKETRALDPERELPDRLLAKVQRLLPVRRNSLVTKAVNIDI